MQYFWLNKQKKNKKLIIFFNGWGMNETPIQNLNYENFDILLISDYRDFNINFSDFDFLKYKEKNLICWSMGVYVSNLYSDFFNDFNKKIAINGTNKIIDNLYGIPNKIYDITIKLFNEKTCEKFIQNMFYNNSISKHITITKNLKELKEELIALKNIQPTKEIIFDLAIISLEDKIVPSKNQIAFWEERAKIKQISSPHCPFDLYSSWADLLC